MNKIKIIVCYHKPFKLHKNECFFPLHVGRDIAEEDSKDGKLKASELEWMYKNMSGDNIGENISDKNRYYCELTALYWAWKNQDLLDYPDYIGLMHYRRLMLFNSKKCHPPKRVVVNACSNYDVILPEKKIAWSKIKKQAVDSVYEQFSIEHGSKGIDIMIEIISNKYPSMIESMNKVLYNSSQISWYNIFIAKKEIFNDYAKWLFELLDSIECEYESNQDKLKESRLFGYLGEILLNIYMEYLKNNNKSIKIGYYPVCRIEDREYLKKGSKLKSILLKKVKHAVKKINKKNTVKNLYIFFKFLKLKREKEIITNISTIHSLSFRVFAPEGGKGGGSAVLSCQKILLGEKYKDFNLKYSFFEEDNYYSSDRKNELWDLWGAVLFAINKTQNEKNTVYITHDYGTAFGLYLMGKRYVHISHLQGPRIEEKRNFGEEISLLSKWIIQYCEKKSFRNAYFVCFPSNGAYEYFCNSKEKTIKKCDFKKGPVLYNTLYAFPEKEQIEDLKPYEGITFLSIGQLTIAKGIDRCPEFFKELLNKTDQNIRWIIVGNGPLKKQIIDKCLELQHKYKHFSYIHFNSCTYKQIQYLQEITDVYIMLQRISIFDLATLELMNKGKVIVLSDAGGNPEFNKQNNIILWSGDNSLTAERLLKANFEEISYLNKKVYNEYFSNDCFRRAYWQLIDELTL